MKTIRIFKILALVIFSGFVVSCDDFLTRTPETDLAPEDYFQEASQLLAYVDGMYTGILPSHGSWSYGTFTNDNGTDNQVGTSAYDRYVAGNWLVSSNNSNWSFSRIMSVNLFLEYAMPGYEAGVIKGSASLIRHYIGEAYFLRAYEYFSRYQSMGDFPIITRELPDDVDTLTLASRRYPRNEVARFIISDLDLAIDYMGDVDLATTRINRDVAVLLKSRVALYEATWLKYFKGTAFVPQGEGWPGKQKNYTVRLRGKDVAIKDYEYPAGDIDTEISYFLETAMDASREISEKYMDRLTGNTGYVQQITAEAPNPFMDMFGDDDLSDYPEVMLWRQYRQGYATHGAVYYAQRGNNGVGLTKGLVDGFLMKDGLPYYTSAMYAGDDVDPVYNSVTGEKRDSAFTLQVRINRDPRLSLFLKECGQKNVLYFDDLGAGAKPVEDIPNLTNTATDYFPTGYAIRKGNSYHQDQVLSNNSSYTGSVTFRAAEALLNYIEASYERLGVLDEYALKYWRKLRTRAGISDDITATIAATDMAIEAKGDWGAYSGGNLVDPTLFNIRRERRCEFMAEGLRYADLRRWRSMDQLIATPYHVEGMKVWNSGVSDYYRFNASGGTRANMSSSALSDYIRVFQKQNSNAAYNGLTWKMAHYLDPVDVEEFLITSDSGKAEESIIYQNPYWPLQASYPAEK